MHSTTRRSFIGEALAAFPLPVLAVVRGRAVGLQRSRPQEYALGRPSQAVLDLAFSEIVEVRAVAGRGLGRREEHMRRLAKATGLFFGHMQEIGVLDALDRQAAAGGDTAVGELGDAGVSVICGELAARGVIIPPGDIRACFARVPKQRRQLVLNKLRAEGIHEFSRRLCRALEAQAGAVEVGYPRQVSLRGAQDVEDTLCDGLKLVAALLAAGCVIGIVPYCAAAALVYLLESVLEYIGFCE